MNRKKKIKSILQAKQKKANAKLQKNTKPKYISKAERAKLALATHSNNAELTEEIRILMLENNGDK